MRCMNRNKKLFYYSTFVEKQPLFETDEYGNQKRTSEYQMVYTNPVPCMANISPAQGEMAVELFGSAEGYDKIIVLDDPHSPIDEYSILWIDSTPDIIQNESDTPPLELTLGSVVIGDNGQFNPHDYIVKRVARSLNSIAIAVRKVSVQ